MFSFRSISEKCEVPNMVDRIILCATRMFWRTDVYSSLSFKYNRANQWSMYPVSMYLNACFTNGTGRCRWIAARCCPAWHLICPHGCFRCLPSCIVLVHCRLAAQLPFNSFKGWVSYFMLLHISISFAYWFIKINILFILIWVYLLQHSFCI